MQNIVLELLSYGFLQPFVTTLIGVAMGIALARREQPVHGDRKS